MELIELKTNIRTTTGNGPARRLRQKGQIPAVLYGPGTESVLLSVNITDIEMVLKKGRIGQALLNLVIPNNGETSTKTAMVKELQHHPVSRDFLHIDFYEVAMDRKIMVNIPVTTIGKAKGVETGGILQIIRRELEVQCFPLDVPESIEIDITDLDVGDSIRLGDIARQSKIEFLDDENFTVVTVVIPKIEEEEEVIEEEEAEGEAVIAEEGEETPESGDKE
ncbi:MAG: 50S ribosomal protein L25/general stress protein Ctc [Deltaproteobacteria bacterium]|nr:50S ribosomal protein L25/general stress protein Ctc [Deltaproteobacteria bacterium]MBW2638921.1 50S ribosomal protein L25/general stress protein Ctc [Deltaproteobacteria bacterium]